MNYKLPGVKLYSDLTKSKFLPSSIVVSSIAVMHLVDGAQFLNAASVAKLQLSIIILPYAKM